MAPKKEIETLAAALKAMPEYREMAARRLRIMNDRKLGATMAGFEREYAHIMSHDMPAEQTEAQLRKLYESRKDFFETAEVKAYMKAANDYHKLVSESVSYLNQLLDV